MINVQQGTFCIVEDIIRVLDKAANEPLLPCGRDEKVNYFSKPLVTLIRSDTIMWTESTFVFLGGEQSLFAYD